MNIGMSFYKWNMTELISSLRKGRFFQATGKATRIFQSQIPSHGTSTSTGNFMGKKISFLVQKFNLFSTDLLFAGPIGQAKWFEK